MDEHGSTAEPPSSEAPEPQGSGLPGSAFPPAPGADLPMGAPVPDAEGTPPRRRGRLIAVIAAVIVVALGAAGAAAFLLMKGAPEELTTIVPADADVFATAYLDPSAGQKVNLFRMLGTFPDLGSGEELQGRVDDALDEVLRGVGLDHADVSPWVGSQLGFAVDVGDDLSPHVALLLVTTDEGATRAAFAKAKEHMTGSWTDAEYDGVAISSNQDQQTALAVVDGVAVLANDETTVKRIVDAAHGTSPSLGSAAGFVGTTSGLPDGKLGLLYVNVAGLLDQFGSTGALSAVAGVSGTTGLDAIKGMAMSVSAEPDGFAVDVTGDYDASKLTDDQRSVLEAPDHENTTLAFVPGDAFALLAQENLDVSLRSALDGLKTSLPEAADAAEAAGVSDAIDALSGDVALEVGPGSGSLPVTGALIVGTDDEQMMRKLLEDLGTYAATEIATQAGGPPGTKPLAPRKDEYKGVTITSFADPSLGSLGIQPAYAFAGGSVLIATSPDEIQALIDAQASGNDIRDAAIFQKTTATVPATESLVYFDVGAIAATVRENLPTELQPQFDREVAPNLEPVGGVAFGSESTPDRQRFRLFVLIT